MAFQSDGMFPANHKTVFVLDHTPYFGISCDSLIEFEFLKTRGTGIIPLTPISKSLWTCSVESAIEYCRIVWDLFPQGKLVRFIVSDTIAHILNTWNSQTQNLTHIMNAMSMIGIPPRSVPANVELSVLHGLRAAVEALSELTDVQKTHLNLADSKQPKLLNNTRVICVTSARDDESMKSLEEIFHNVLLAQNKLLVGNENTLIINHCHLVIINISPNNMDSPVSNHPPKELSSILTTEVHSIKAPTISMKLSHLILQHYDLASTTVTGIPMKEEQNASSSANYDVEIYHASAAHTAILKGNTADTAMIKNLREGFEYETVTLKWCTPRGCSAQEMQNCTAMHRITPVDVNSRPSSCLINFLLNGRSVMLEMPRKSGGKIISHLLAAHGGEIFIHTLYTARSVLEDPPSISEGPGGRVTDYRITDFGTFIQNNKLAPMKNKPDDGLLPVEKMLARLDRQTKYWPITISSTLVFNLKNYIDPLPQLMTKDTLTDEEVVQCKQVIYNLIGLESKHEPLHLINVGHRIKGQKREDQYKALWSEIETLLKNNCHTKNHTAVYNCLLECHKFPVEETEAKISDKVELDQALRELDQLGKPDVPDQLARASVIRATTDSPMSPPPLTSISSNGTKNISRSSNSIYGGPKSFLDIFMSMEKDQQRTEFHGRLVTDGPIAQLYPNLNLDKDRGPKPDVSMEVE